MDTAVPTTPNIASPYTWEDADPAIKAAHGVPMQSLDGGPQVSQPVDQVSEPVDNATPANAETPRGAVVRRLATAAAGVGLVAAAVLTARGLRGANARAGANVIDYDD